MLADFVDNVSEFLEGVVGAFGTPGIVVIAFLENMFPPTPSEFLYPLAGKIAADGDVTLFGVIFAGLIGSLVGSMVYYMLGYWLGPERTRALIANYGTVNLFGWRVQIVTVEAFDRALGWFEKRGGIVIIVVRNLPLIHSAVSIPAGVVRMNVLLFLLYTSIGVLLWIAPLATLGYWLGNNWERVLELLEIYQNLWYIVLAALLVWFVIRRLRSRKKSAEIVEN
jgi:membrane protein DedA with SNARE-associated domain